MVGRVNNKAILASNDHFFHIGAFITLGKKAAYDVSNFNLIKRRSAFVRLITLSAYLFINSSKTIQMKAMIISFVCI